MELWDIYDKDRHRTGKTMVRSHDVKEGDYHLVVHICIINSEGKMLIQQRQPFKDGWPDMWDISAGGSAIAGETSCEAAEREVFEEIGYKASFKEKRPSFTVNFDCGFDDYYIINDDIDIDSLKLQYEEVQNVKWADKDEIYAMIDDKCFIPYHKSLIEMLYEMKDYMGANQKN